ncbi:putative bifunctional diguanylate cyclase/phosphodiesterase [Paractinoplanes lichenicola]|uniref:Bifunctional diguanylate cyclase/phosphodiesterase n=1 Tax=Paractinoplanes lichenicola TaxID=2802976 RepID=A0ABS1W5W0_9ACTN|nr:bifunctional diguanylate cyclase/phosphodiesterase [Actinoplanes lichenicola]MBL7262119.1 bifunctional diguanylate cyclase/phosphodiesterase [Actinoplanes lichenicola]
MTSVRLPRKLGEIGIPVDVLPDSVRFAEIAELLSAEPLLPGVLVASADGHQLLSRARVGRVGTGRGGLGSALTVLGPDGPGTLTLPSDTDIDQAAQAALARPVDALDEPVVVRWPDGRCGIAPVLGLLTAMAGRYARLARADQLTGLPNRAAVLAAGRQRLEDGLLTAVLHLGLDRFSEANDMLGTQGADMLLQRVGARLRAACRTEDLVARLEGDQFVVLLAVPGPAEGLTTIARRLTDALRGPYTVNGIPVSVETSIGVSLADHRDLAVVLRHATDALRGAKRDRTGVVLWTAENVTTHRADLRQLTELRTGIRAGHLRLHYQPLYSAGAREIHGAEALVRWQHPQRGMLPPGVFLPDAERSDVILELTDWVFAEAVHQAAVWHRAGHDVPVSVNLSAAYLAQDRAVPTILALLALERLPARLLTVEITETAVLTRPDEAAARLAEIRAAGIRVAIDDFGTGYTSLGLLPELPIDELKIDRSFVVRMHDSPARATIIDSVIAIARSLDLTVVAEGVEDEPTAAALADAGVDLLQGYHLDRPQPADQLESKFTKSSGGLPGHPAPVGF